MSLTDSTRRMKRILGRHYHSRYLPEEILFKIFSHLSAEDLTCFKCVSKRWRSLISNPNFVRTHFLSVFPKLQKQGQQLLFQTIEKPNNHASYHACRHFSINNIPTPTTPKQLKFKSQQQLSLSLEACCDGLVLFQDKTNPRQLYISNPITGNLRALPPTPRFPHRSWAILRDATCYDNTYTVFGLTAFTDAILLSFGDKTTTTSCWSSIQFRDPALGITHHVLSQLTVIDNEIHWLTLDKDDNDHVCYCMQHINIHTKTSTSTQVPLQLLKPPSNLLDFASNNGFHVLSDIGGGSICVIIVSSHQLQALVLVDISNGGWAKFPTINLHSLSNLPSLVNGFLSCNVCVIALTGIDSPGNLLKILKILVHHEGQLWLYDMKSRVMKPLGVLSENQKLCRQYYFHSNSLLWWD